MGSHVLPYNYVCICMLYLPTSYQVNYYKHNKVLDDSEQIKIKRTRQYSDRSMTNISLLQIKK